LPRMLKALTSVARLSFSMTLLSRPSSPLSATPLPTRHPSDGLLSRYRKPSSAAAAAAAAGAGFAGAESTSSDTEWSSPSRTTTRSDDRRRRRPTNYDLRLSPPRERSRSDATAYYRRRRRDETQLILGDIVIKCNDRKRSDDSLHDVTDSNDDVPHALKH